MPCNLSTAYSNYKAQADADRLNQLLQAVTAYVRTVCRHSGSIHAEDAAQDVAVKVWEKLGQFRGQYSFG